MPTFENRGHLADLPDGGGRTLETAAAGLLGLYCFAAFFEGFLQGFLPWPLRAKYAGIAFLLLWPHMAFHAVGLTGFVLAVIVEKTVLKRQAARTVPG